MGGCSIVTVDGYNKIGAQGVVMPAVKAKIRTDDGQIRDIGKNPISGELLLNSDSLTCGKLDGKEVVKTIEIDGERFLETKDKVSFDSLGNVEYIGRKDGMFQRYDCYNVYPLQIENLFKSYPNIKNAAIVSQYSEEKNGIIPKVVIELVNDNDDIDKKAMIEEIIKKSFISNEHKFEYIANFRDMPHVWDFVKEMPINTMEKNDLFALQNEMYESERYILNVEEDNMSIKNYSIEKIEKTKQR